jgi:hypothetical protein
VDCSQVFVCLSAELDGELPASESEAVRRHLAHCEACTRRRLLLEQTRWAFRTMPTDVASAVAASRARFWPAWAGASALVVASLAYLVFQPQLERLQAPAPTANGVRHETQVLMSLRLDGHAAGAGPGADCGLTNAVSCYVVIPCADTGCRPSTALPGLRVAESATFVMANE